MKSSTENLPSDPFPPGFLWGAGTSAYQIEGAADQRGKNVWDTFSHTPGKVIDGDTGDVACDHLHRWREDVSVMRQIGLQAYRFSISWPRLLPGGVGQTSEAGLAFYDSLVDELLEHGIQPWVTLFHWDFPQDLFDQGGWLSPNAPLWFADYARVIVDRLSDRVGHWITINEPQSFLHYGHATGTNAPGLKLSIADQLTAAHNVLLSHGRAVSVIRETSRLTPIIGWAPCGLTMAPGERTPGHIEAARRGTMEVLAPDLWNNAWFNEPVFRGAYPESGLEQFGSAVPRHDDADMDVISAEVDFLGLNIYTSTPVEPGGANRCRELQIPPGHPRTAFDWPVYHEALEWGARFHWERYQKPIYITENGMANIDWVATDGAVHDPQRIDFTRRYLSSLRNTIAEGADVRGYFHWSLLDNFEWAQGYRKRFGLVHVDYATQKRTLKDSAHWYRRLIESNGALLD